MNLPPLAYHATLNRKSLCGSRDEAQSSGYKTGHHFCTALSLWMCKLLRGTNIYWGFTMYLVLYITCLTSSLQLPFGGSSAFIPTLQMRTIKPRETMRLAPKHGEEAAVRTWASGSVCATYDSALCLMTLNYIYGKVIPDCGRKLKEPSSCPWLTLFIGHGSKASRIRTSWCAWKLSTCRPEGDLTELPSPCPYPSIKWPFVFCLNIQ